MSPAAGQSGSRKVPEAPSLCSRALHSTPTPGGASQTLPTFPSGYFSLKWGCPFREKGKPGLCIPIFLIGSEKLNPALSTKPPLVQAFPGRYFLSAGLLMETAGFPLPTLPPPPQALIPAALETKL